MSPRLSSGHMFKQWPYLEVELAHAVRCDSAIIDGKIVCLDGDGRSNFHKLLFRREWPFFCAFDLLKVGGRDLRNLPLIERKIRLKRSCRTWRARCAMWITSRAAASSSAALRVRTISKGSS